jgi:hypothetical protein
VTLPLNSRPVPYTLVIRLGRGRRKRPDHRRGVSCARREMARLWASSASIRVREALSGSA